MKRIIIILISIHFTACNTICKTCPNIKEELKSYVPYKQNDVVMFKTDCETIAFNVNNYIINKSENACENESGCHENIAINITNDYLYRISLTIGTEVEGEEPFIRFYFYSYATNTHSSLTKKINQASNEDIYTDSLRTYTNCYTISSEVSEQEYIDKVVIAPNLGIVRIIFNNGEVWRLVEE